jgi:large subunit ribosomal protein MRP49
LILPLCQAICLTACSAYSQLTHLPEGDRKETIDVQHRHESDIIKEVIQVTKAKQLPINPEDNQLANEYLEDKQKKLVGEANKMARRAAKKEQEKLESGVTA